MLQLYLNFIFTMLCKIVMVSYGMTIQEPQENCLVSLVIPKESIKATCNGGSNYHTEQKLKFVESQLSAIRKDMNNLNIRLTYTLTHTANNKDKEDISRRLGKLESTVKDLQTNITDRVHDTYKEGSSETFNRRKVVRLIRRELEDMKEEIKRDIHYEFRQQLKDDIRSELFSYAIRNNKLVHGINSEILLNTVANDIEQYEKRNYYEHNVQTENHHKHDINDQKRHRYTSNEYDEMVSAFNNELPEKPQSKMLQADSQTKEMDIQEAIVILNNEVKQHLDKQTQKVKEIVGQHLNLTETKLSKVSKNLNMKFDKFEPKSTDKEYKVISGKLEQIEHEIETLGAGLSSLLQENTMFSSEIKKQFELEKLDLEESIISKLSEKSNLAKLELENLRNKTQAMSNLIQATARSQQQTQYSLQNFNATYKLKNFYLEESIRRMTVQIQELNMTVHPDYDNAVTLDEAMDRLDIEDAVIFVAEIKETWPFIVGNISSIIETRKNDLEFVQEGFKLAKSKVDNVIQNQTKCSNRINKLQSEVKDIQNTIVFNEQIKRQAALNKNEWAQFNFNHTYGRSGCYGGKKFVKKTGYAVGSFVGVVLCSEERYKIYLSDSLNEMFLNIGDTNENGEDHCEFVGANRNSPVTLKKGPTHFERIPGYKRGNWGEVPIKAKLSFFSPTPEWYECGVTIP